MPNIFGQLVICDQNYDHEDDDPDDNNDMYDDKEGPHDCKKDFFH